MTKIKKEEREEFIKIINWLKNQGEGLGRIDKFKISKRNPFNIEIVIVFPAGKVSISSINYIIKGFINRLKALDDKYDSDLPVVLTLATPTHYSFISAWKIDDKIAVRKLDKKGNTSNDYKLMTVGEFLINFAEKEDVIFEVTAMELLSAK